MELQAGLLTLFAVGNDLASELDAGLHVFRMLAFALHAAVDLLGGLVTRHCSRGFILRHSKRNRNHEYCQCLQNQDPFHLKPPRIFSCAEQPLGPFFVAVFGGCDT